MINRRALNSSMNTAIKTRTQNIYSVQISDNKYSCGIEKCKRGNTHDQLNKAY